MDAVEVSVLVPVLNEEAHIRGAVESMRAQRFDGAIEFIFIDGGSTDATPAILEELAAEDPRLRLLDNPRRITPVALNIGLEQARGEVVVRMDAHTHYPPDYIARGVERLRRGDAAHVSGPQIAVGQGRWSRRVATALATRLGTGGADFRHLAGGEIEVDSGFTGMWLRSTLERHGGWDERWMNDQDTELAARIRAEGGLVVCLPEMAASYIPRDSLWRLARQYWRYGFYRALTSRHHPESMRRSHVLAPGLVCAVLASTRPGRLGRAGLAGVALWALAVAAVSVRAGRSRGPSEVGGLALVFVAMHAAWGLGFLAGSLRWGPPVGALWRLVTRSRPTAGEQ
jgi:succinoglycan biosynthesis protein ExoA